MNTPADRVRAYAADLAATPGAEDIPLERQWLTGRDGRELATVADLFSVLAELEQYRGELGRLWYFTDRQARLDDILTGKPEHHIVNGDHSGCDCGTDWFPPPVELEWAISHPHAVNDEDCRHAAADVLEARRMAGDGSYFTVVRRLVGQWRPEDEP